MILVAGGSNLQLPVCRDFVTDKGSDFCYAQGESNATGNGCYRGET